jgi:ribosomal protein S18 acetylase RimI-like enzyme
MSDALTIRPLRADDAAQWRTIRLESLKAHPIAFQSSYEEAVTKDLAFFAGRIPPANSDSALFGAFIDGNLVGTCGLQVLTGPKQRHKAQVWGMYVTPAARRHGAGAALVQAAIDHARTRVAIVSLVVSMQNDAARALYRRMGFVAYGVEKRALRYEGVDHDDELMALDLGNGL